jgi:adenosylmethionine-8-amino-7-oxononanoate aminotransferase
VEIALKMALQAQSQRGQPQRTHFAALTNGYHGETVGALAVGDLGLYAAPFAALTFPVTKLARVPYRSGPNDPQWMNVDQEWTAMQAQLETIAPSLAAIIYEPVLQAAGGMRLVSPALLGRLRSWARVHGVYLIADEIAAGMGRLGTMLATHLASPSPEVLLDFVLLSKGLTAGFLPLSAVLTTDELYQVFDDASVQRAFLHSNTYTGNALGVAAALAALDVYAAEDVLTTVKQRAIDLQHAMSELVSTRPFVRNLRALGMVAAVDLHDRSGNALDPRLRTGRNVCREAIARGAFLRPLGDTMYLFPPLNTASSDVREIVSILAESIDVVVR